MNEKTVIDAKELERARKRAKRREWIQQKKVDAYNFYQNNKNELMIFVPAVAGVTTAVVKTVGKHNSQHREKNLKENYCYDRSLGHYWQLRRKPSNSEWVEIDRRKRNGERLADILDEMRLLK